MNDFWEIDLDGPHGTSVMARVWFEYESRTLTPNPDSHEYDALVEATLQVQDVKGNWVATKYKLDRARQLKFWAEYQQYKLDRIPVPEAA